jgi:carbon monoxide dehydrogenase subunit G
MSQVTTSIAIDAPPERVWDVVMDPHCLHTWVTIHRKLLHCEEGPLHVGYRMDQRICLRGVTVEVHWELVDCEPNRRAVWKGRGPARSRAETEYLLKPAGDGTHFDYHNDFHAPLGPVGAIFSRALVGGIPQREANRSLDQLKGQIERHK